MIELVNLAFLVLVLAWLMQIFLMIYMLEEVLGYVY